MKHSRCELRLSPQCVGQAEVRMTADTIAANACPACGKLFQSRFPHAVSTLTLRPLEA